MKDKDKIIAILNVWGVHPKAMEEIADRILAIQEEEALAKERYIEALIEYQQLLNDELSELAPIAFTQGWRTSREGIGVRSRARLEKLRIASGYEPTK